VPGSPCTAGQATARRAALQFNNRCHNHLLTARQAPTKRGHALLGHWRAQSHVTPCPQRISAIAAAALIPSEERGRKFY
jgi:hypothetical protein